ncbi:MAG: T9SS type A sorting domain-containing protein [Bacteroidota bacterium]
MILRRAFLLLLILSLPYAGWSQGITVIGLPNSTRSPGKDIHPAGRTKALTLPFWDDFSDTETVYANVDRWLYGQSVNVNTGLAINPPSLRVATFDGLDSLGKPYNATNILAKGYSDKLVSMSIDLSVIPVVNRDSVFLSYKYQVKGLGELPDDGDRLLVSFLDKDSHWIPVDTVNNDGTLETDIFYTSFIQITDPRYYHADFKFMIQNFGRQSGPYDAWHLDYIYLNKKRWANDDSFPDRMISTPPTSLFGKYWIMPTDHFLANNGVMSKPSVVATSLQAAHPQPFDFSSSADITVWSNKEKSESMQNLDVDQQFDTALTVGIFQKVVAKTTPDLLTASATADSITVLYKFWINTRDNESIFPDFPGDTIFGDYDPRIYSPIDFRKNDTTYSVYRLSDKYAYDDGGAEYGAGLNQPGAQLAYRYDLVGVQQENITFLEMYFPRFGDESSQTIELRIWNTLDGDPIYTEVTSLQRSQLNQFWVKQLTTPVPVKQSFYIGWKQSAAAVIAVGLDKNSDTGDRMSYNTNGTWVANDPVTGVHGSLMLRPIFGPGLNIDPNGLEDETTLTVYPNPSNGVFYFPGNAEQISIYDMAGRTIPHHKETTQTETMITMSNASPGIYIIKAHVNGGVRTAKVLIR